MATLRCEKKKENQGKRSKPMFSMESILFKKPKRKHKDMFANITSEEFHSLTENNLEGLMQNLSILP